MSFHRREGQKEENRGGERRYLRGHLTLGRQEYRTKRKKGPLETRKGTSEQCKTA